MKWWRATLAALGTVESMTSSTTRRIVAVAAVITTFASVAATVFTGIAAFVCAFAVIAVSAAMILATSTNKSQAQPAVTLGVTAAVAVAAACDRCSLQLMATQRAARINVMRVALLRVGQRVFAVRQVQLAALREVVACHSRSTGHG